jgi:hypothetical protein
MVYFFLSQQQSKLLGPQFLNLKNLLLQDASGSAPEKIL